MNIQIVFAFSETHNVKGEKEFAFGLENGLPWGKVSRDMKNFAERTKNTMLVMGANTFSSLPGLLPSRPHCVVISKGRSLPKTAKGQTADYYIFEEDLISLFETGKCGGLAAYNAFSHTKELQFHKGYENISVIGGKSLLMQSLKYADKIVMSEIIKKCYVLSDVKIDLESICNEIISNFKLHESHEWCELDELTSLKEKVYVRKAQ